MRKYAALFSLIILLYPACKTPPPPPEEAPRAALVFERVEADSIHHITLRFTLRTENPRAVPLGFAINGWKTVVDGVELTPENAALSWEEPLEAPAGSVVETPLVLRLDLTDFAEESGGGTTPDEDNYHAELTLDLAYRYPLARTSGEASAIAVFPRIREPRFTITSIAIMQAELINTRFRVSLRVDNPNPFPVTLSSFAYELYGDGLFWAEGREKNVLDIPAKGSAETKLFLLMNFIDMKRSLLDEIIAMDLVNYRFAGAAEVAVDIPWLPRFSMQFDLSGLSEVFR